MGDYRASGFDDEAAVQRAHERAESMALDDFDVSNVHLFRQRYALAVLRTSAHGSARSTTAADSHHGPYLVADAVSTTSNASMPTTERSPRTTISRSSDQRGRTSVMPSSLRWIRRSIDVQRKAVAHGGAAQSRGTRRQRSARGSCAILDSLPVGEPFNWVEHVSIELTTQMLATLLDFPFDDRRKLTHWSDVMSGGTIQRRDAFARASSWPNCSECLGRFTDSGTRRRNNRLATT